MKKNIPNFIEKSMVMNLEFFNKPAIYVWNVPLKIFLIIVRKVLLKNLKKNPQL